jgi:hypothetical protein
MNTSTSCAREQRPSSWRVTSARTLANAGCDGRSAADRGPAVHAGDDSGPPPRPGPLSARAVRRTAATSPRRAGRRAPSA